MELEKDVQRACLNWLLKEARVFAFRCNTTGIFDRELGFFRGAAKRGVPDIIVIAGVRGGQFIGIECKRPGAKQREDQINFQKSVTAAGGEYWLIHSLDELKRMWYNYVKEDKIV